MLPDQGQEEFNSSAKPIFFLKSDFFPQKALKSQWITNTEIYKAIAIEVPPEHISGLQRVKGMWRIYTDSDDTCTSEEVLCEGFALRGKSINTYNANPKPFLSEPTVRVRVGNVPLSADDGQIKKALKEHNCDIIAFFREKLRVDNKLTNCETGNRIALISPPTEALPEAMRIGKYYASIYHYGQPRDVTCNNCLVKGYR